MAAWRFGCGADCSWEWNLVTLGIIAAVLAALVLVMINCFVIPVDLCLKGPSCNLVYPKNMIGMRSLKLFEEWLIEQINSQRYPANTPITAPS